ncbi:hypothetical protein [Reichenbachiella versicolor]|uniref:hypothetical protein n=1 Tax=Reichenbachiella versicolor TaxID=1821036 RepID=UPI000D6E93AB|nr:hypothetical protein [Reichenbachiella versicolor]
MAKCWICNGDLPLTGEHKFKASLLRKGYGKKYKNEDSLYLIKNGQPKEEERIESYKSPLVKFENSICADCNNAKTDPHDNSFDQFMSYIESNYHLLLEQQNLNFESIFQLDWLTQKRNLFKYLAKIIGCKLQSINKESPLNELSNFIIEDLTPYRFNIKFELNEGVHYLYQSAKINNKNYYHLYYGSTTYYVNRKHDMSFGGWVSFQWITVHWIFSSYIKSSIKDNLSSSCSSLKIKSINDCKSFINMTPLEIVEEIETSSRENQQKRYKHCMQMEDEKYL